MDHIYISDASGKAIISQINADCINTCIAPCAASGAVVCEKFKECNRSELRRRGRITNQFGAAFFCTSDPDMLASKRVFMRTLDMYANMIGSLIDIQKSTAGEVRREDRRLVHNLTTLNSHIIQEIYNIIPQDELAGSPARQISLIAEKINADPIAAAQAALRILKNAVAARTEMQVVRRLESAPQLPLQRRAHMIHRVIKNVLVTFFQDSQERGLTWNLRNCTEKALIDYESVSAAMYRLFENFIKYCAPGTTIDIAFQIEARSIEILMEMISIPILPGEETKIFEEGYSGAKAREYELSGSGLGMSIVKHMLEANNTSVSAFAGKKVQTIQNIDYTPNRFVVVVPRAL